MVEKSNAWQKIPKSNVLFVENDFDPDEPDGPPDLLTEIRPKTHQETGSQRHPAPGSGFANVE